MGENRTQTAESGVRMYSAGLLLLPLPVSWDKLDLVKKSEYVLFW